MLRERVQHVKVRQLPGPANRYLAKPEKWGEHDDCDILANETISYRSNAYDAQIKSICNHLAVCQ